LPAPCHPPGAAHDSPADPPTGYVNMNSACMICPMPPAAEHTVLHAVATVGALAVACALLSVFVVARRWAFMGEGISHAGFGGAGTAWLLALVFPAIDTPWLPYASVVVFCLLTAVAIGWLSRRERLNADAAIGIFLVASLAWGILAQQICSYRHRPPPAFDALLFGRMASVSGSYTLAAVCASLAIVVVLLALAKEIIYYAFDPAMAEVSGVPAGFIHYLMMVLVALTIIIGVRILGSVMVTALLVLPGATALILSGRLRSVIFLALAASIFGAMAGLLISLKWNFIPTGPAIVLLLFLEFVAAWLWNAASGIRGSRAVE